MAFHFGFERAVESPGINLLPLEEITRLDLGLEFLGGEEVVILAIDLCATDGAVGRGYAERQIVPLLHEPPDKGRLSCTGRCRKGHGPHVVRCMLRFGHCFLLDGVFDHNMLSTCSLIFSSSSFIWTTMRCMAASWLLLPKVLISLPISWLMNPSFFPWPLSPSSISRK